LSDSVIQTVRRALGRSAPLEKLPIPPEIDDAVARLAAKDGDVVERFARSAIEAKFLFDRVPVDRIASDLVEFLRLNRCEKVGIPTSDLLTQLRIPEAIEAAGMKLLRWNESSLDAAYDLDCGVTDVYAAVAETGSLVIRPDANHGRALSLVPPIHIAIVEPGKIVADLIDLFAQLAAESRAPNITLITGPSKTADIEGALVTGVHGPGVVRVYLLQ
jgi:L-lactate dehydrogenase complex protein LldG